MSLLAAPPRNSSQITSRRNSLIHSSTLNTEIPTPQHANMHIWRPLKDEEATVANLLISVLRGLPRPDMPYAARNRRSFGTTLLDKAHILGTTAIYEDIVPNPTSFLAQNAKETLKPTFFKPIGKVAVKDVIQIGSKHSPTLALELESGVLEQEMHTLAEMCNTLNGTSLHAHPTPHVSIVKFPDAYGVPRQVVQEVEAVAPTELYIGPGRIHIHT